MTNDKISMYVSRENEIRSIHETVSFGSMHIIKMHQKLANVELFLIDRA